jgi:uncharacterized protein (UPF0371 family)
LKKILANPKEQGELMVNIGFDNAKYVTMQSEHIKKRINQFGGKLYLEFGGKLFDDHHASRVLPGFEPDSKIRMLMQLKEDVEVIIVISAGTIEKNKVNGNLGITYDMDVLRLIDAFRAIDINDISVVLAQFGGQQAAKLFQKRLSSMGINVYLHYSIEGYPQDVPYIVSDEGYGRNEYIKTSKSLVVVTAPGPGSGKMATCLSQLYHDHKNGIKAGYAKFETFPIWNLPLKHPVNLAYEAATADLNDVIMIDPFHLDAYGKTSVNYTRDVEIFPVLSTIFEGIYGKSPYKSPTDMGVNMVGNCIIDDDICKQAARNEIIRRHYAALCGVRKGVAMEEEAQKTALVMRQADVGPQNRPVIQAALDRAEETGAPAAAMQLPGGRIITGKTSSLLGATSALLLNALKALGNMPDELHLISPTIIEPIQELKVKHLGNNNPRLHTDEVLVALSISAATSEAAELAMKQLKNLRGLEAHSSVILSNVDENVYSKLGVNLTCDPHYQTKKLYHKR